MKGLLCLLLVFHFCQSDLNAKTYYFSASKGDDSRTIIQAQHSATPWRSLEKLNSIMALLEPGDSILLLRGDIFKGTINISKSGSKQKHIVISTYGPTVKAAPVIDGRVRLTQWVRFRGDIWGCRTPELPDFVNLFSINGKFFSMGRYPNPDETEDGYLRLESADSNLAIIDRELKGEPNWTGAELVIKPKRWLIDRNVITKHLDSVIWYETKSSYVPWKGFGYFIQNHIGTLDRFGEWYFNAAANKIFVYFKDESPARYQIQISLHDILLHADNQSYVNISGLHFVGANKDAINLTKSRNFIIENCTISHAGLNGISGLEVSDLRVVNNTIQDVYNTGIFLMKDCYNTEIKGNIIKRCGLIDGTGPSGNSKTEGVSIGGNNNVVENNVIDSIGYIGIHFSGNNVLIKNNVVRNFTMVKDDGGGIYTVAGKRPLVTFRDRKIIGNIVMNGIGNGAGTNQSDFRSAIGIYMDDCSSGTEIRDNIVGHCAEIGIFLHDAREINVINNLAFECGIPFAMHQDIIWRGGTMHSNVINRNIFISSFNTPLLSSYRTQENDIKRFGEIDSNFFYYPVIADTINNNLFEEVIESTLRQKYSISEWQNKYQYEINSQFLSIDNKHYSKYIRIFYNDRRNKKTINLGHEQYSDPGGRIFKGTLILDPYEWVCLIKVN